MGLYLNAERKTINSELITDISQVITVLPLSDIGNETGNFTSSGISYANVVVDDPLQPIGSLILGLNSFSSPNFVDVNTSTASFISTGSWGKLNKYLPPRQTIGGSVTSGTNVEIGSSTWIYISSLNKWVQVIGGTTTINIYDNSIFPNTPVAKTSPFSFATSASNVSYLCVAMAYGAGKLCILNRSYGTSVQNCLISSDLNTFTQFSFPISGQYQNIIYNETNFIVTTYTGSVSYGYTSSDGQNFIQRQNFGNLGEMLLASNKTGLDIAIQKTGSKVFLSSNNGTSFIEYALPISSTWVNFVFSSRLQCFFGVSTDGKVVYSNNGVNWNYYLSGISSVRAFIETNFGFIIGVGAYLAGTGTNFFPFSINGINWGELYTSRITGSKSCYGVFSGGNCFISVNAQNTSTAYSTKITLESTELEVMPIVAPTNGTATKYFIKGK